MGFVENAINGVKTAISSAVKGEDLGKSVDQMQDEDFIKEVEKVYELKDQKAVYEKQWYLNLSFLLGQQWVKWNNNLKKLYEEKVPAWRVRHVANAILPAFRKKLAKLNKNRPTLFISSGKEGPEGEIAARESNKMVEYWWSSPVIQMENELLEWKSYALSCGTGFLKVFFDPTIGTERSKTDEATNETTDWRDGELQFETCSPFEIVFDPPDARKWKDLRSIMHYRVRTLEYINAKYPENGSKVVSEKDVSTAASFWQKISGMVGSTMEGGINLSDKADKSAIVKELWIFPCKRFPKGQRIVTANKVKLFADDLPYVWLGSDDPFVPIVPLYDMKVPGRIWGRCDIDDEIPISQANNELVSHIRESERLTSKPKVLNPVGSGVTDLDSEPGEFVEWDPTTTSGHKPEWMSPPPIPSYLINGLRKMYESDFQMVSSQHEVSKGQIPPGVTSGVAINYLQEQDDTTIGDVVRQYERALELVGNMALSIVKQNYNESRKLQIVGDNGQVGELEYKPENKETGEKGTIPEGARLVVEAGSSMPRTQTGKQAFILDLHNRGILGQKGDPATNKRVLKMLEMGNVNEIYEEDAADQAQADMENEGMKKAIAQQVMGFQNHEVHLKAHESVMKSPEFISFPEQAKTLFMQHRDEHQNRIMPPAEPGAAPGPGPAGAPA